jgi:hypothetical protein
VRFFQGQPAHIVFTAQDQADMVACMKLLMVCQGATEGDGRRAGRGQVFRR